ncbi:MAG: tyrosine-type recombinase/integrase [Verrucomicrobiae bacterium]|nr:tyrosine-type recombinase/integrase [Verrucomicrobiae bacterium]
MRSIYNQRFAMQKMAQKNFLDTDFVYGYADHMGKSNARSDGMERVADNLYRYVPTGGYYGIFRSHGKLVKKSLKSTHLPEAKRLLRDELDKRDRVDARAGKMTLSALCKDYLDGLSQSPKTIAQKRQIADRIEAEWPHPSRAECQIRDVKPADVSKWLASYDFGVSSYNAHLWFIRGVFDHAIANHRLAENPAAKVKAKKRAKPIRRTPSFEQFQNIVQSVRQQPLNARSEASADFIEFMGLAGVGNAEIRNLKWADIDFETGSITVFRQKTRSGYVIPIFPQLRPLLEKIKGDRVPHPDEGVFSIHDAKKALAAACERLEYPHFDHRSLRRMFVTRALQRGVDVKTVSSWQGHKDGGRLILATYSHVIDSHSAKMAELLSIDEEE